MLGRSLSPRLACSRYVGCNTEAAGGETESCPRTFSVSGLFLPGLAWMVENSDDGGLLDQPSFTQVHRSHGRAPILLPGMDNVV